MFSRFLTGHKTTTNLERMCAQGNSFFRKYKGMIVVDETPGWFLDECASGQVVNEECHIRSASRMIKRMRENSVNVDGGSCFFVQSRSGIATYRCGPYAPVNVIVAFGTKDPGTKVVSCHVPFIVCAGSGRAVHWGQLRVFQFCEGT
jgi:hypothetical protein